jgi:two-component system, LytTR family, sensor kinase
MATPLPLFLRPAERPVLSRGVVIASILGFWLFYVVIVSLRAGVMDFPQQGELAVRRAFVTILGIVVTIGLWLIIRWFDHRPLIQRVIVTIIAAIPCAFAIAGVNYYFFNVYDAASLFEDPAIQKLVGHQDSWTQVVADTAIQRYFFLVAWAAIYIAMTYAALVQSSERRAAEFAQAAQAAELRSLRYQVNPHFLFNTLNSLSALVLTGRREQAETMIQNLSTFYRTSLSGDPTEDVPLADEVRLQRLYLDIEGVRFPERLKTIIDVPPALETACVPGLILQPLVENAVKYGVSATGRPVRIVIRAKRDGERLSLCVSDDGPGVSAAGACGNGIGLANVRDRLAARFGDGADLQHGPDPEGGYRVTMTLPLVQNGC